MGLFKKLYSFFSVSTKESGSFDEYYRDLKEESSKKLEEDVDKFLEEASLEEKMQVLAEEARESYNLDYSPESLKQLNKVLEDFKREYSDAKLINPQSREELNRIMNERPRDFEYTKNMGMFETHARAYLGEVIIREFGGEWTKEDLSDALKRQGINTSGEEAKIVGISVPVNEEAFNLINVSKLAAKAINGDIKLYDAYKSAEDLVEENDSDRNRKIFDEDDFDIIDLRQEAKEFSEKQKVELSPEGLKQIDEIVDNLDEETIEKESLREEFIPSVGYFLGVVVEEYLDLDIDKKQDQFVLPVPRSEYDMILNVVAEEVINNKASTYQIFQKMEKELNNQK